jgi:hypothetical protein
MAKDKDAQKTRVSLYHSFMDFPQTFQGSFKSHKAAMKALPEAQSRAGFGIITMVDEPDPGFKIGQKVTSAG